MAALAAFAQSDKGLFYMRTCERFGVDPSAGFSDDVVAHNFRVALMVAENERPEESIAEDTADGRRVHNPGLIP